MGWQDLRRALALRLADRMQGWAEALRRRSVPDRKQAAQAGTSQGKADEAAPERTGQHSPDLPRQPGEPPAHWLAMVKGGGPPEYWLKLASQGKGWIGTRRAASPAPVRHSSGEAPFRPRQFSNPLRPEAGQPVSPRFRLAVEPASGKTPEQPIAETQPDNASAARHQGKEAHRDLVPRAAASFKRWPSERGQKVGFRLLPGRSRPAAPNTVQPSGPAGDMPASHSYEASSAPQLQPPQAAPPPSGRPPLFERGEPTSSGSGDQLPLAGDFPRTAPERSSQFASEALPVKQPLSVSPERSLLGPQHSQKGIAGPLPDVAASPLATPAPPGYHPWQTSAERPAPRFSVEFKAPGLETPPNGNGRRQAPGIAPPQAASDRSQFQDSTSSPAATSHWLPLPELPADFASEAPGSEDWEVELREWQHLQKLEREQRGLLWNE